MSGKRLLFMHHSHELTQMFWTPECDRLARQYGFTVDVPAREKDATVDDWAKRANGCDGVITTWSSPMCNQAFLEQAPSVKIIGHAAGSAAAVTDISTYQTPVTVVTANLVMAQTVAEWSMMMTLIAQRRLTDYAKLRPGETCHWDLRFGFADISQTVVGIWGMGDITKAFLKLLQPFGPKQILIYSEHTPEKVINDMGAAKAAGFEELLQYSDILHCLAGMTPNNLRKLDGAKLSLLRDGSTLINAGRARLIDNEALQKELSAGRIRAVLDVFESEPLPADSPWHQLDNLILTPHAAAGSGQQKYAPYILNLFDRFFAGDTDFPQIDGKRFATMTNEKCGV